MGLTSDELFPQYFRQCIQYRGAVADIQHNQVILPVEMRRGHPRHHICADARPCGADKLRFPISVRRACVPEDLNVLAIHRQRLTFGGKEGLRNFARSDNRESFGAQIVEQSRKSFVCITSRRSLAVSVCSRVSGTTLL